jgi:hypothetical protein
MMLINVRNLHYVSYRAQYFLGNPRLIFYKKLFFFVHLFLGDGRIDYNEFVALGTQSPIYI